MNFECFTWGIIFNCFWYFSFIIKEISEIIYWFHEYYPKKEDINTQATNNRRKLWLNGHKESLLNKQPKKIYEKIFFPTIDHKKKLLRAFREEKQKFIKKKMFHILSHVPLYFFHNFYSSSFCCLLLCFFLIIYDIFMSLFRTKISYLNKWINNMWRLLFSRGLLNE